MEKSEDPSSTVLSEDDQVDCLVDLATDPNVLGRTWEGWAPFV